jgi:hypothetical protein
VACPPTLARIVSFPRGFGAGVGEAAGSGAGVGGGAELGLGGGVAEGAGAAMSRGSMAMAMASCIAEASSMQSLVDAKLRAPRSRPSAFRSSTLPASWSRSRSIVAVIDRAASAAKGS